ncbi:hypothetical protein EJ04DRAFT_398472, partial [Polyplosphaeria fusca]
MRLGTKSCAECRRRKVRCEVPQEGGACTGCVLHSIPCVPQQPRARPNKPASIYSASEAGAGGQENEALRQRLAHLERMMGDLRGDFDVQQDTTQFPDEYDDSDDDLNDNSQVHLDAPLPALWQTTPHIQSVPPRVTSNASQSIGSKSPKMLLALQVPPIPNSSDLNTLFQELEQYWVVWPPCTLGKTPRQLTSGQIHETKTAIIEAIYSNNPILVAKALLWLAFCVFQFPRPRIQRDMNLPKPARELIDEYLSYSEMAINSVDVFGHSMDELECYGLLWKMLFDMGKPRKAWQILRQAITSAMQLGLHKTSNHNDKRRKILWPMFWQTERQLSCILGLPSCTSDTHPGTTPDEVPNTTPLETASYKISIIAGKIIERDQIHSSSNFARTLRIDEDLEKLTDSMPPGFWEPEDPEQDFAVIYYSMYAKFRYWYLQKTLHMPYMLKSIKESKYQHSFDRAMDAARGMILLNHHSRQLGPDIMCEAMEFHGFSSAIVLLIGVLARQTPNDRTFKSDWDLLDMTSQDLRQTAVRLDCIVAKQGADALDILLATSRGAYAGKEDLTMTIPYFGQVKVN